MLKALCSLFCNGAGKVTLNGLYILSTFNLLLHLFACVWTCTEVREHLVGTSSFLSDMWALRIELRSSGLTASTFTAEPSCWPLSLDYMWRWGSHYIVQVTSNVMIFMPGLWSRWDYRHPYHHLWFVHLAFEMLSHCGLALLTCTSRMASRLQGSFCLPPRHCIHCNCAASGSMPCFILFLRIELRFSCFHSRHFTDSASSLVPLLTLKQKKSEKLFVYVCVCLSVSQRTTQRNHD